MLFSGRANPGLAQEVAVQLGTELVPTSAYDFANGEIYVRFEESVRGSDAFVIQSHTNPINECDHGAPAHGRRAEAGQCQADHRGHAVLRLRPPGQEAPRPRADQRPPDGRHVQDGRRRPADLRRPAHRPDPGLLRRAGRPPDGDPDPRRSTSPRSTATRTSRWSRRTPAGSRSPSSGRSGSAACRWPSSTRPATSTVPNEMVANRVVGLVRDRVCVLVDDMIDTGGTITKAADALMADGAKAVVIAATHAILSDPAVERLRDCSAEEVIVTNTLPIAAGEGDRRHHRAVDRPADQRRHQGGLRGRLGHEPLRRPRLTGDARVLVPESTDRSVGLQRAGSRFGLTAAPRLTRRRALLPSGVLAPEVSCCSSSPPECRSATGARICKGNAKTLLWFVKERLRENHMPGAGCPEAGICRVVAAGSRN